MNFRWIERCEWEMMQIRCRQHILYSDFITAQSRKDEDASCLLWPEWVAIIGVLVEIYKVKHYRIIEYFLAVYGAENKVFAFNIVICNGRESKSISRIEKRSNLNNTSYLSLPPLFCCVSPVGRLYVALVSSWSESD